MSQEIENDEYHLIIERRGAYVSMMPKKRKASSSSVDEACLKLKVLVLAGFGGISKQMYKLWNDQHKIPNVELTLDTSCPHEISVLVVGSNITDRSKVLKKLDWVDLPDAEHFQVVTEEWVFRCIQKRELLCREKFLHRITTNPSAAAEETDSAAELEKRKISPDPVSPDARAQPVDSQSRPKNLNEHLTSHLRQIVDYFKKRGNAPTKDDFTQRSYKNAIHCLESLSYKVTTPQQLKGLRDEGAITESKMNTLTQLLQRGHSDKLDELQRDPFNCASLALGGIHGVGPKAIRALYELGIRNIDDVRRSLSFEPPPYKFSHAMLVGIHHYEALQLAMPREEVSRLAAYVRSHVSELCPGAETFPAGSYRRGELTSHDCDCFVQVPPGYPAVNLLHALVPRMTAAGFLTDNLTSTGANSVSYMGVCRELGREGALHRRIDIKVYPPETCATALLYFTGPTNFNRGLRTYVDTWEHAGHTKHVLSDLGLRPVVGAEKVEGAAIPCQTEEDVFKVLGLVFLPPTQRGEFKACLPRRTAETWVEPEEDGEDGDGERGKEEEEEVVGGCAGLGQGEAPPTPQPFPDSQATEDSQRL